MTTRSAQKRKPAPKPNLVADPADPAPEPPAAPTAGPEPAGGAPPPLQVQADPPPPPVAELGDHAPAAESDAPSPIPAPGEPDELGEEPPPPPPTVDAAELAELVGGAYAMVVNLVVARWRPEAPLTDAERAELARTGGKLIAYYLPAALTPEQIMWGEAIAAVGAVVVPRLASPKPTPATMAPAAGGRIVSPDQAAADAERMQRSEADVAAAELKRFGQLA